MKKLFWQIFKFGIVGFLSFFIDFTLLIVLAELFGIWYLIASFFSFSISVVFNYYFSMRMVFVGKKDVSKKKEFTLFVFFSVIGLGTNQLGMYIMVSIFSIYYVFSKIVVTVIVMTWNFISRKIFLEDHNNG